MTGTDTADVSASTAWGFLQSVPENALQGGALSIFSAAMAVLLVVGLGWGLKKVFARHKVAAELTAAHQNTFNQQAARCAAETELLCKEVDQLSVILEQINQSVDDRL
ncbi:MAG: GPO family capsid scaffolding protein [Hyphomonas sp.]|uniref:hypothetical protein n=1 Tax=Hyphomonas sp. TaxID=87 RepID=UPI0017D07408|nr:hypothetical protein [Hyphomonas sp.]MBA3069344.1 GPO family capsid scaffolding protein [Hyphomonas sp.]MBU4063726.1 hypothetical protein [Alphaproteobacteria bacterium]MBU4164313.1 hypothetical protein [Alphaproteobacteria bacterium]MBU4567499.1 hypothetical protein [Alphaproteobacteria bacterium]